MSLPFPKQKIFVLPLVAFFVSALTQAESLSLDDAIARALEHNLDIQLSEVAVERAAESITIAKAEFDPALFFDAGIGESLSPQNSSTLEGASQPFSESWDASASVSKKISFGTTFQVGSGIDRRETNSTISTFNPEFNSDLFLSIEQPLLRGAGRRVNLVARRLAESSSEQSRLALMAQTLDVLRDTELSYWELAYQRERLALRKSSIKAAEKLLDETEERERIGVATKVDVLQARASLASRQESVILSEAAIARTQDELLEIVGLKDWASEELSVGELPAELEGPPDQGSFVQAATARDLDLREQLEVIERSRLRVARARNERMPELNLRLSGSYLGRDTSGSGAYRGAFDRDGYNWRGGLELRFPLGLREERARERQAQRDLRTAELDHAKLKQDLFYELRSVWRDASTGQKRLDVAAVAVELQSEQFAEEEARYSAGLVTLRQVLEAQEDWDAARLSYLDALIDSLQAQVIISRLDGSMMERHGLTWDE